VIKTSSEEYRLPRRFDSKKEGLAAEAALIAEFLASEMPPAKLPETGSSDAPALAIALLLSGGGLVLAGLSLQRLRASL
jgi:LPXTG-motif cell wall-anchored protein